ncbi:MAG: exodeoxyribonuclease VII large subunit [Acholeplasmataceae bacterium]|nr:exodeoxyribonuclease VII large subunit [Acholeplasmataceae bacterium]
MNYLTVSALTKYIKTKLEGDKHLVSLYLKGEISNFKHHSRGHFYFTLKDENAQISAIMFAREASGVLFSPKEGDHVLVEGRISLYEPSGTYSIQISKMTQDGVGELYLKYEQLKKELEEKGYFKVDHKRSIPKFPRAIGVVTSPTGAVIEDIKNTIDRRYRLTEIHLYPALVQGTGSVESIGNQIKLANERNEVDVLIVGRGGGSIEDLWAFNEMPVIEAIYQSKIPVITAIGHETDFTISDFVSDLRAPTPTAAAELATPNVVDLMERLDELSGQSMYRIAQVLGNKKTLLVHLDQRLLSPSDQMRRLKNDLERLEIELRRNVLYQLELKKSKVENLYNRLKSPHEKLERSKVGHQILKGRLQQSIEKIYQSKIHPYQLLTTALTSLNPLLMMDKGYAVVSKQKSVITSVMDVKVDDQVEIRFKDGRVDAKIIGKKD